MQLISKAAQYHFAVHSRTNKRGNKVVLGLTIQDGETWNAEQVKD